MFFKFVEGLIKKSPFDGTYVGPYRPPWTYPIQRWGEAALVARWDAEDYEAVEQNLEGLIADIPNMTIREIPQRYQCHTVGVSESIGRLLRRVARAVVCYRESHP
jgi:hypothetical protein